MVLRLVLLKRGLTRLDHAADDGKLLIGGGELAALALHHLAAAGGIFLVAADAAFEFVHALAVEFDLALRPLDFRAMLARLLPQCINRGLDLVVGLARL